MVPGTRFFSISHVVYRTAGFLNSCECFFPTIVEVDIDMANRLDFIFGSCRGIMLEWIHPSINYVELEGVFIVLELERHDPGLLGAD
jgi:hypothetical protein